MPDFVCRSGCRWIVVRMWSKVPMGRANIGATSAT